MSQREEEIKMIDIKQIEANPEGFKAALRKRNQDDAFLSELTSLSEKRRQMITQNERLKATRNEVSSQIASLKKKQKDDPSAEKEAESKVLEMRALGSEIQALDQSLRSLEDQLNDILLRIANLPDEDVPEGKDEHQNVEIRSWGKVPEFNFDPKDHIELGESLEILDFERAAKLSGARFSVYRQAGATLERALIQFMLDEHTRLNGYQEVIPPFLVTPETMQGTGQLPKFEEDLFKTQSSDRELYLIPTAEVPLTNLYANEILKPEDLPIKLTAYTPCFRSEAGSHGKDVRGLFRQHQFQKVELVNLTLPEASDQALEQMTEAAESILQKLGLPYRVMLLCGGDMGFSAAKTYDIEVWLPGQQRYREISSCSNCRDFQARRAKIRYKKEKKKNEFLHTLNGSGLAVGRTFIAVLENYQNDHGDIRIPDVLKRYCEGAPGFTLKDDALWILKP